MANFRDNDVCVSSYIHSHRHQYAQFGLIVDYIKGEVVAETPSTLTLRITERTDSVMNRGVMAETSFEIEIDKEVSDV